MSDWTRAFDKRTDSPHWQEGFDAYMGELHIDHNPYPRFTSENSLWDDGWHAAHEEWSKNFDPID